MILRMGHKKSMDDILHILKKEFNLEEYQIKNIMLLIEDGNTIPFIARYRKEMTGGLDDQLLRELSDRLQYLKNLWTRKDEIIRLIDEQDKLNDVIIQNIKQAKTLQEVEDIYRPFRPKKRTRANIAKEKGLEPFAKILYEQNISQENINDTAENYINIEKGINNVEDVLNGAMDIIAEEISDNPNYRKLIRNLTWQKGIIMANAIKEEDSVYNMYYDFREPVSNIASHRILAINRGEKEEFLKITIEAPEEEAIDYIKEQIIVNKNSISVKYIELAVEDAYKRLIRPSIEREIRSELTEEAHEQAIKIFAINLQNLLLQAPIKKAKVLAIDPAYRTGCKIAAIDEIGNLLDTTIIYPTPPQNKLEQAKEKVKKLIDTYKISIIAIGNGTASKETEIFTADLIKEINKQVFYIIVNEAGASVYSASKMGVEEFPDLDVSLRSAISIGRRLQDPLAELVKIDPKSIGVGQYQHDVNQKRLNETLNGVVEYCVNNVGVDLNTASKSLLKYISGINNTVAKNIIEYREESGKFINREQLKKIKGLGPKSYEQAAGFLRIADGENILDNTSVHPESYEATIKLLKVLNYSIKDIKADNLEDFKNRILKINLKEISKDIDVGLPTLKDIINELLKPGRDPREDMPKPIMLKDVLNIKDLKKGMVLRGTIRNVIDFGAFVDIGVQQDGLVHISELSSKYVKHPMDIVSVGDIVEVKILEVDIDKNRISLSMK